MLLPAQIEVLGHHYSVRVEENREVSLGRIDSADSALGFTDLQRERITIRGGGEQSDDQVRDTLLHEVIHVAEYLTHCELHESQVRRLATVLLDALRSNPALAEALLSK